MTWCSKNTESPCASASSATGTISPSIWHVEFENLNSVMSRSLGASAQPESDTRFFLSSGAPQVVQLVREGSFWALHHWHSIRSIRRPFWSGCRYATQRESGWHANPERAPVRGNEQAGYPADTVLGPRPAPARLTGVSADYCVGGAVAVPQSAQNFAPGLSMASQLV